MEHLSKNTFFKARMRRWERPIPLLAGTLKLAVINVSIWLVYGTDHPDSLPEHDSAHYSLTILNASLAVLDTRMMITEKVCCL